MKRIMQCITSITLSLMLTAACFPFAAFATSAKVTGVTMQSLNEPTADIAAKLNTSENIIRGAAYAGIAEISGGKKIYARAWDGDRVAKTIVCNDIKRMYDGIYNTSDSECNFTGYSSTELLPTGIEYDDKTNASNGCYNTSLRILYNKYTVSQDPEGYYTGVGGGLSDTTVYQIIFDLGSDFDVNTIMLGLDTKGGCQAKKYDMYMAKNSDDLFNSESMVYSVDDNTAKVNQYDLSGYTNKVRYIGLNVTQGVPDNMSATNAPYSYLRLYEVGIFGTSYDRAVVETDITKVDGLSDDVADPSKNIVLNYSNSALGTLGGYCTSKMDNGLYQSFNFYSSEKLTDGDLTAKHTDMGAPKFVDADGNYTGNYLDFSFSFPNVATINNFLLASCSENDKTLFTEEYALFASNNVAELYNDSNMLQYYTNDAATAAQYFTFNTPVVAQYFGIRIYKGVNNATGARNYSYARIREIAVFGTCEVPEYDKITSTQASKQCIDALKTSSNLLYDSGYTTSAVPGASAFSISGCLKGDTSNSSGSYMSYATENDMIDGNVATHCDIHSNVVSGAVTYVNDNKEYNENTYIDITVGLKYAANVEKIFIAWPQTASLRAAEYELYYSDSAETLYDVANKKYSFENIKKATYQTFQFDSATKMSYIGIRILKGVILPDYNYGAGSSYARMAEIAVFGNYDCDYYDYTATSSKGNLLSDSGNTYTGKKISYEAPLTKDGFSFTGWKINGEAADGVTDIYSNTASISLVIDKNTNIVAEYTDDPTELSSNKYTISSDKTKIRMPFRAIAFDAIYGFNQYPANISVKNGAESLQNGDTLANGMKVELSAAGAVAQTLSVVTEGDYNADNSVSVTDIVAAVDGMLAKSQITNDNLFAFDSNSDGAITVTDLIKARYAIVNFTDTSYQNSTIPMNELKYKATGRTVVNDDNSLQLEMTATGFSFNANFYGDLVLSVSQNSSVAYYTVIIDGKEMPDVQLVVNNADKRDVTFAKNVDRGIHTVEIYKQLEAGNLFKIYGVSINGTILEAPKNNDLLVEFVGDSITCGAGNLSPKGAPASGRHENGYLAYGTQTAILLGSDWSNISQSGSSLVNLDPRGNQIMPIVYNHVGTANTADWNFERKADVVVVNLGTNDPGVLGAATGYETQEAKIQKFTEDAYNFGKQLAQINGNQVKIVFAFGLMTPEGEDYWVDKCYKDVSAQLNSEGLNTYYCKLPKNTDGGSNHPSVAGDKAAAEVLSQFINTTVLGR